MLGGILKKIALAQGIVVFLIGTISGFLDFNLLTLFLMLQGGQALSSFVNILLSLIVGIMAAIPLYALGELLELLHEIRVDVSCIRQSSESGAPTIVSQSQAKPGSLPPPKTGWRCESCEYENNISARSCKGCGKSKPQTTAGAGTPPPPKIGWKCQECAEENTVTAWTCKGCGKSK